MPFIQVIRCCLSKAVFGLMYTPAISLNPAMYLVHISMCLSLCSLTYIRLQLKVQINELALLIRPIDQVEFTAFKSSF